MKGDILLPEERGVGTTGKPHRDGLPKKKKKCTKKPRSKRVRGREARGSPLAEGRKEGRPIQLPSGNEYELWKEILGTPLIF